MTEVLCFAVSNNGEVVVDVFGLVASGSAGVGIGALGGLSTSCEKRENII